MIGQKGGEGAIILFFGEPNTCCYLHKGSWVILQNLSETTKGGTFFFPSHFEAKKMMAGSSAVKWRKENKDDPDQEYTLHKKNNLESHECKTHLIKADLLEANKA